MDDIAQRTTELSQNKLNLPWRAPGDIQQPKLSQWGHQQTIDDLKGNLANRQAQYKSKCDDNDPGSSSCPVGNPGPHPQNQNAQGSKAWQNPFQKLPWWFPPIPVPEPLPIIPVPV